MDAYRSLCEKYGYPVTGENQDSQDQEKNNKNGFSEGIVSYAQNFEDVMLWRALGHIKNGFYIDVGAQDPIIDSVSRAFYEHGWRGISVEATPHYAELLRKDRPDEIVLQSALSEMHDSIKFYEIIGSGLSTGVESIAQKHKQNGFLIQEITVPCLTLADIFVFAGERDIHWLKIDVEGMEKQVLVGWGKSNVRPWIVVVESTLPNTQIETHEQWEYLVLKLGYQLVYFDGLSRFYVSDYHSELINAFRYGPNIFDGFTLSGTSGGYCSKINAIHNQQVKEMRQEIESLKLVIEEQQSQKK